MKPKNYPCVDCGMLNAADRPNTRCQPCGAKHARQQSAAWQALHRSRRRKVRAPQVIAEPQPQKRDLDIEMYRIVKQQRAEDVAAQMKEAAAALARELELTKPKPGRPKKARAA